MKDILNQRLADVAEAKKAIEHLQEELKKAKEVLGMAEAALKRAEEVNAKAEVSNGLIKVQVTPFTFPFSYYGGGNPKKKTFGESKLEYMPAGQALHLVEKEFVYEFGGSGLAYELVN